MYSPEKDIPEVKTAWHDYVEEELHAARASIEQVHTINTITARIGNVGELYGPEKEEEWNAQSAAQDTEARLNKWLDQYPSVDSRIAAAVDMAEQQDHPWHKAKKYFKEIPLGEPIVSSDIEEHHLGRLDSNSDLIETFSLPKEENTELHFSFLDEDEEGYQDNEAPVTAFFTEKVASIALNTPETSEVNVYRQLRVIIDPELLAELHPALKNAVQPLALEHKEDLSLLLQETLAEALMEAKTPGIAPVVSRHFMQIEQIKMHTNNISEEFEEDEFGDSALRITQPPSSLGLGERQSSSDLAA